MKKYEIALIGKNFTKTYEYETMATMQKELASFVKYKDEDLFMIEISIIEQDIDGETFLGYTFCEIDMNELRKGEM